MRGEGAKRRLPPQGGSQGRDKSAWGVEKIRGCTEKRPSFPSGEPSAVIPQGHKGPLPGLAQGPSPWHTRDLADTGTFPPRTTRPAPSYPGCRVSLARALASLCYHPRFFLLNKSADPFFHPFESWLRWTTDWGGQRPGSQTAGLQTAQAQGLPLVCPPTHSSPAPQECKSSPSQAFPWLLSHSGCPRSSGHPGGLYFSHLLTERGSEQEATGLRASAASGRAGLALEQTMPPEEDARTAFLLP